MNEKSYSTALSADVEKVTNFVLKNLKQEKKEIKIIGETEMEDCIDVETVSEQVPGNPSSFYFKLTCYEI